MSLGQFGEETAIQIGEGGLKGMTLSQEMVAEWVDYFPNTAFLSNAIDHIYPIQDKRAEC